MYLFSSNIAAFLAAMIDVGVTYPKQTTITGKFISMPFIRPQTRIASTNDLKKTEY